MKQLVEKVTGFAKAHKIWTGIIILVLVFGAVISSSQEPTEEDKLWKDAEKQVEADAKQDAKNEAKAEAKEKAYKKTDEYKAKQLKDEIKNPPNVEIKSVEFNSDRKFAFVIMEGHETFTEKKDKRMAELASIDVVNDIKDSKVDVDTVVIQGNINGKEIYQEEMTIKK